MRAQPRTGVCMERPAWGGRRLQVVAGSGGASDCSLVADL